jgi:hypothetical protein
MSEIIFESQFYSLSDHDYRVRLYGKNYVGLYAAIIGGTGNVFYVQNDWRDFLQVGQSVNFGDNTGGAIVAAYEARVLADGGVFENEQCLLEFLSDAATVVSFTYNAAQNRTEITLNIAYDSQSIIQNDVTGTSSFIPTFSPVIIDLVNNYKNSDDYILSPLMTSSVDVTYGNVQEDRTGVDTAFFDRFIDLYLQSNDDELRLTIEKNESGYKLDWAGNLVMDLIQWSNENSPREYVFRVIDGIDRIKDVEYVGDVANLQNRKIKDVIFDVLELNGLTEFWGDSDIYLRESVEYAAIDVVGVNGSDSLIDYTYLYENLLMNKEAESKDDRVFLSGYDILYGIMEMLSCRMMHTNGHYYMQQIRNYDTITIVNRDYVKGRTYNQGNYTHSNTSMRVLAGGTFGYLYGIKQARIESENKDIMNIGQLPPGQMHAVNFLSGGGGQGLQILPSINQNIGDIQGGLAAGQFINVQFDINSVLIANFDADIVVRLYVYESNGNKFLKGSDTIAPYWDTAAIATNKYYEKKLVIRGNGNILKQQVKMTTPLIPYEMEGVIVAINLVMTNVRKAPANNTLVLFLENTIVSIPEQTENTLETLSATNPNEKFTKDLQMNNLMINEGNAAVQVNNLTVDENYNGGAFSPKIGSDWDADFDVTGNLSVLRVMEAVSIQYKPLQKYMGDFDGIYYPFETIPYNNAVFACSGLQINYLSNEVSGEWFEVLISRVGLSGTITGKDGEEYDPNENELLFRTARENDRGVGILEDDLSPTTGITSITIDSTGDIRIGDAVQFMSDTGDILLEVISTVDLDTAGTGQTLGVESFNLANEIPSGSRIVYGYKKVEYAERVRAKLFQMEGSALAPTSESGGDYFQNGEFMFHESYLYWRDGNGDYHRLQGNTHHPD